MTAPTALYRHYDAAGCLLYVGMSANPQRRIWEQRCRTGWAHLVARTVTEWFDSRSTAENAERKAIRDEAPVYNIAKVAPREPCASGHLTAREIITLFGSTRALGDALGVPRETVKKWSQRGSIPAEHDLALVAAAADRGLPITLDTMARMRAAQSAAA